MEQKVISEIRALSAFLDLIRGTPPNPQPAVVTLAATYAAVLEVDPELAWRELMRFAINMPNLVADLPLSSQRAVAEKVSNRLDRMLHPEVIAREFGTYVKQNSANIEFILDTIAIFDELKFDNDTLKISIPKILDGISDLKGKIANSDSLSDASRTVLFGQLDLLQKAVGRFHVSGVGSFRDTVYSIYGKITIQLDSDQSIDATSKKDIIDGVLRLYAIFETGGNLLQLGKPIIAGLLSAPSS